MLNLKFISIIIFTFLISKWCVASELKDFEVKRPSLLKLEDVEYKLNVSFSNISIGKLTYKISTGKEKVLTTIKLKTNSFYDFIFKIRDNIIGEYDIASKSPKKFIFNKKEGKKESYVSMDFDKDKITFNEKWRKKKKEGKKNKVYSPEGKSFFDITLMINYLIFMGKDLVPGNFFWLALKSNFYKVTLQKKEAVKLKFQGKVLDGFKLWFKSIKGEKSQKRGEFSLVILKSSKPLFFELQGLMKIGKIKGVLTDVN